VTVLVLLCFSEIISKTFFLLTATSDGSEGGIDARKGGVCTRFNMKLKLEIHPPEREYTVLIL